MIKIMDEHARAIKAIHDKDYSIVKKDFNDWIRKDPKFFLEKLSLMLETDRQEMLNFFSNNNAYELMDSSVKSLPKKTRVLTKAAALSIIKKYKN